MIERYQPALITWLDEWIDTSQEHTVYKGNQLAIDMSRILKIGEETGEMISVPYEPNKCIPEICDVILTAECAIQHFTKNYGNTRGIIESVRPDPWTVRFYGGIVQERTCVRALHTVIAASGRAVASYIGYTGQNPRKRVTHSIDNVLTSLAQVIIDTEYALFLYMNAPEVHKVNGVIGKHIYKTYARACPATKISLELLQS